MSGGRCKAAIDCTGWIFHMIMTIFLIMTRNINNPKAIEAFNDLKPKMEAMYEEWKAKYINFDSSEDDDD